MINPSDIKLNTLPWLPLEEKTAFPKRPAIYFAIDSLGYIQYIGRAVNVRNRWGNHHRYSELNAIGNVKIAYLFVDAPELLPEIESALIQYFEPNLNREIACTTRTDSLSNTSKQPGGRRKDPNYKQLNLNLPPELIKKLRLKAVEKEISISELAEKIFEKWFGNEGND